MLLAATLPGDTPVHDLWRAYASPAPHLRDVVVMDPFLGGGTTLVEAARLGARTHGTDVDPLAVLINQHQLTAPAPQDVVAAGDALTAHLRATIGRLWPVTREPDGGRWSPLHYFSVAVVTCPHCGHTGPLYRSLVIARSVGHAGSVVRDVPVTAFCPDCFGVHDRGEKDKALTCCGVTRPLADSNFRGTRYVCPSCGCRSSHEMLQTGAAPRVLLAVEETPGDGSQRANGSRRRIRAADDRDRTLARRRGSQAALADLPAYDLPIRSAPNDSRPVSLGIGTIADLHTARQRAYLTAALRWLKGAELDPPVARALGLAISSTITSNNRLCGYATDYGRLAPLFSIRAFSLPWLAVELNPLNPSGGRGTLAAALTRVVRSCEDTARRHVLDAHGQVVPVTLTWPRRHDGHQVHCADASATQPDVDGTAGVLADLCVTDPPYYDFIPYDTLSQVYRAWLPDAQELAGQPLLPYGDDPVGQFGARLGQTLAFAVSSCKPDAVVAFTYKGDAVAWDAVAVGLDQAKLRVTGLWPVLADPHMGHHTHEGNCEYDMIVVTRPLTATEPWPPPADASAEVWISTLRPVLRVSAADEANMRSAIRIAAPRWGRSTSS
jgi:putative DNA methylase